MNKSIAIQLGFNDLDKIKQGLKELGVEGEKVFQKLEQASKKPAAGTKSFENMRDRLDESSRAASQFLDSINKINNAFGKGRITDPYTKEILSGNEALKERNRLISLANDRAQASGILTANRSSIQERVNVTTGVIGRGTSDGRAADIEAYGQGLNQLKARYVPLYAEQMRYKQALADIRKANALGAISQDEEAAAITRTKAAFASQIKMMGLSKQSTQLNRMQLLTLQYTFNDVVASLSSGISPMTILMQQGGQVTQAFGGLSGTLKSLLNPTTLAIAGIAGLVGGLGVLAVSSEKVERGFLSMETVLAATGRTAALSRAELDQYVTQISNIPGTDRGDAEQGLQTLLKTRQVGVDMYQNLIDVAGDYASATGKDVPEALAELANGMKRPTDMANQLHDNFGLLSYEQYKQIAAAEKAGHAYEAQGIIINTLKENLHGLQKDGLTPIQESTDKLGNSWDNLKKSFSESKLGEDVVNAAARVLEYAQTALNYFSLARNFLSQDKAGAMSSLVSLYSNNNSQSSTAPLAAQPSTQLTVPSKLEQPKKSATQGQDYSSKSFLERLREEEEAQKRTEAENKRIAETRDRATESIENQIKALHDENDGMDMSDRDRAIHNELIKAENTARQAEIDLTKTQRDALEAESAALYDKKEANAEVKKEQDRQKREYEQAVQHTTDKISDAFVDALDGSKTAWESFRDFSLNIIKEIAANAVIRPLIQPVVESALQSTKSLSLSSLMASVFHSGGEVGGSSAMRSISPLAFAGAPRYHSGILNLGLKSDERPAILQTGETVLPRGTKIGAGVNPKFEFNVKVDGTAASDPKVAAQSGAAFATAAKAQLIALLQEQQRAGGVLYR